MNDKTQASAQEARSAGTGTREATPSSGKSDWIQASREVQALANQYRWLGRVGEILAEIGDLDAVERTKRAAIARLTAEEEAIGETVAKANDEARRMVAEAKTRADALTAAAETAKAEAEAKTRQADEAVAASVEKLEAKQREFAEVDRKLRDTRAAMAELRKNL